MGVWTSGIKQCLKLKERKTALTVESENGIMLSTQSANSIDKNDGLILLFGSYFGSKKDDERQINPKREVEHIKVPNLYQSTDNIIQLQPQLSSGNLNGKATEKYSNAVTDLDLEKVQDLPPEQKSSTRASLTRPSSNYSPRSCIPTVTDIDSEPGLDKIATSADEEVDYKPDSGNKITLRDEEVGGEVGEEVEYLPPSIIVIESKESSNLATWFRKLRRGYQEKFGIPDISTDEKDERGCNESASTAVDANLDSIRIANKRSYTL